MDQDDIRRVLEDVASGKETVDDAVLKLRMEPFEDLGYAKIDHHRGVRHIQNRGQKLAVDLFHRGSRGHFAVHCGGVCGAGHAKV